MKSIMISIQPKWVEKIASGEKTIEVRKTRPKLETPFKCYIYATKPKKYYKVCRFMATSDENLYLVNGKIKMANGFEYWGDGVDYEFISGKVIGEFVCDRIKNIEIPIKNRTTPDMQIFSIESCLSVEELANYIGNGQVGYGWHISDLKIYDKPKELNEFGTFCDGVGGKIGCSGCEYYYYENTESGSQEECCCNNLRPLTRPPQSWQFVEKGE